MSDGQLVGVVIALAMVALWFYVTWEFYLAPLRDEWAELAATVDALRADIDADLHAMPCVDAAAAVLVEELMVDIEEALS